MKKVMFLVVCLMIVSTVAFALESGPSNKVGYIKITCTGSSPTSYSYTAFGLPFKFWDVPTGNVPTYGVESRKPSSIVGTQANCGNIATADKIIRQNGAISAYRNSASSCNWTGSLELNSLMEPGRSYYYGNRTGAARTLVLAGEADTTASGIPADTIFAPSTSTGSAYTQYSWWDPRVRNRATLNLVESGFTGGNIATSDKVLEQQSGGFFFCSTANPPVWTSNSTPPLVSVTPGYSYYIINRHMGHQYMYQYHANNNNIIAPPAGDNLPLTIPTELQRVTPTVKTKAATSRVSHAAN